MSCFHPLKAYWATPKGSGITFNIKDTIYKTSWPLQCGKCTGCRTENARQWALRIKHEASLHQNNSFITLTYNEEHLPENGTLVLKHFQDFMKRLRKKLSPKIIRFYHCGEYGTRGTKRPHYHAIIFNHQFKNLIPIVGKHEKLHTSSELYNLWFKPIDVEKGEPIPDPTSIGHHSIGEVTFESASYVANYVQKKITGRLAESINPKTGLRHYERLNLDGEIQSVKPEYSTMSRRPGIAGDWLTQHHSDIYPSDFVTHKGYKQSLPKYYDRLFTSWYPQIMATIKQARQEKAQSLPKLTKEALFQKERHHKAKMALYKKDKL